MPKSSRRNFSLSDDAYRTLAYRAAVVGCYVSEVMEALIIQYLPPPPESFKPSRTQQGRLIPIVKEEEDSI